MNVTTSLEKIDNKLAKRKFVDAAKDFHHKSARIHTLNLFNQKGKQYHQDLAALEERIGSKGSVEVLASRAIEEDNTSVSLFSIEGDPSNDERFKMLLLVARRWDDKGLIVEEEFLPVGSTEEAKKYFPDHSLGAKRIQPRLSFITPTRKRGGKGGGRPRKPIGPGDLHRLPLVGKSVVDGLHDAGIKTFAALSKASDKALEKVRANAGRRFKNFDPTFWRAAAAHAVAGEWDKIGAPPKAVKVTSKKDAKIDLSALADDDLNSVPKVGPQMLNAMIANGIKTFKDLAALTDEKLEKLRTEGGRPFVNFDMSYFRKVGEKKLAGAKSMPTPPKPMPKAKVKKGRTKKEKVINPNDLHVLPGVGVQLVAALHKANINTFSDVASADKDVLENARSQTKGKYKNINIAFLQRQAKYAAEGRFGKLNKAVKVDKQAAAPTSKLSATERHLARLQKATNKDLDVLPGVGPSVKTAMNEKGISTFSQLARAKDDILTAIKENAGRRFARFDINFWKQSAAHAHAGDFDKIPVKPPTAPKPKKVKGAKRAKRTSRPAPAPKNNNDLISLPSVGAKVVEAMNANGIKTFNQLANASLEKLVVVSEASGPKYKGFAVDYWKTVAALAKDGKHEEYPPVPKKAKKAKSGKKRKAKAKTALPEGAETLTDLPGIGAKVQEKLFAAGVKTYAQLAKATISSLEAIRDEVGYRVAKANVRDWKNVAAQAAKGDWHLIDPSKYSTPAGAPAKKAKAATAPADGDDLTRIKGIGPKAQQMFRTRGVKTYADIIKMNDDALEQLVDESGARNTNGTKVKEAAGKYMSKSSTRAVKTTAKAKPSARKAAAKKKPAAKAKTATRKTAAKAKPAAKKTAAKAKPAAKKTTAKAKPAAKKTAAKRKPAAKKK
jgi:predicted flap endonuclease-1-like 5' DNA nuclease